MTFYKAFNKDFTCREYQFQIGKTYTHPDKIKLGSSGFHCCKNILDCLDFYDPVCSRFCEVQIIGDYKTKDNKTVTNKMRIIREITGEELNDMLTGNVTITDGSQRWYKQGRRHRDWDRPARIGADGSQWWFMEGELHRDQDQPAIIKTSGYQAWYSGGKRHRDGDLPAVIEADGTQHWYRWDQRHRNRDRPAIIWSDGYQLWYRNGVQI